MPLVETWFVVQVVSQAEARVAAMLEYKGYRTFAPTYLLRQQWSDRIKTLEKMLFPGYVFVQAEGIVSGLICSTPGVIRILSFGGRPCSVPDVEIDAVRRMILVGKPRPIPYFNVGQKVKIKEGPFAGIVGTVTQIKNRACLVISLQLISQSIYVEVDELQIGLAARAIADADRTSRSSSRSTAAQ